MTRRSSHLRDVSGSSRESRDNRQGINGAALLDRIEHTIRRYCVLPSDHAVTGVVLWGATTHVVHHLDYAPRLVVRSPEKRSGKSRLLEVLAELVHAPLRTVNASTAYIYRSLDADRPPTLLFDEADTMFGSKKVAENNEDLRGLLNAGFQRGMTVGRTIGPQHTPAEFETFAMAAIAGIGRMPDTIEDRAVVIRMRRRKASETVAPYRLSRDAPGVRALRDELDQWANELGDRPAHRRPAGLGVEDRGSPAEVDIQLAGFRACWKDVHMSVSRRRFTPEFKVEAAHRVIDTGRPIAEVARELGIHEVTLGKWVNDERRRVDAAKIADGEPLNTIERAELNALRRRVADQEKDLEFLKKAAAYFAANPPKPNGSR